MNPRVLTADVIGVVIAALATILVTPLVMRLALHFGAARAPHSRDVHTGVIPRWGGIAIYLGFMLGIVAMVAFLGRLHGVRASLPHLAEPALIKAIVLGGTLLMIVGAFDDVFELPAWPQFLAQFAAAGILIAYGIRIEFISNPFGPLIGLGWWQYPITVLWVVGIINAINWIDGVDGLAAGVCAIAAGTLGIMGLRADYGTISLIAVALLGSCIGFLYHNFNPAKIFMAGGALFAGFVLAAISAAGAFKVAATVALVAPLIVLGIPIFDVVFVIARRILRKTPIYKADKSHLHHRLLARGYTQRQTVIILYAASIILSFVALGVSEITK